MFILNAVLRIYWRQNNKSFFSAVFCLYVAHDVVIKVSLFRENCLPQKIPRCAPVTFSVTFHPNFHPNILVLENLLIYIKPIHDNISLVFQKPRIFYLVLLWRRYKMLFVHINICIKETLISVILKKIYFIFICKY